MVINRQSHEILIGTGGVFSKGTDLIIPRAIILKEDFRPDVESMESEDAIFFRVIGISDTVASEVLLARRNVRNEITMVGNSLNFTDIVNNSAGKVEITDSGAAISVKMDTILVDNVAHGGIKSSEGSESTAETVANEVIIVVRVHCEGLSNFAEKEGSDVVLVVIVEIFADNGVPDGVNIEFHGNRVGNFLEQLGLCVGSTERNDESVVLSVDQKSVGKLIILSNCDGNLVNEGIRAEIIAGVTTLPGKEMLRWAVGGGGSSEHFEGEGNVERTLNGGSDEEKDQKERKENGFVHKRGSD